MRAALRMLDVSAHNTANLNTDGYRGQTVEMRETQGGVTTRVVQSTGTGPVRADAYGNLFEASNTNIVEAVTSGIIARHMFSANLAAFKRADEAERSVIDILG